MLPREPERKQERELLEERKALFEEFAQRHARFVNQEKLLPEQKIRVDKLAELYEAYRREPEISIEDFPEKPRHFEAYDTQKWKALEPLERYCLLHTARAEAIAAIIDGAISMEEFKENGFHPGAGPCLDIGAGSCFFIRAMQGRQIQRKLALMEHLLYVLENGEMSMEEILKHINRAMNSDISLDEIGGHVVSGISSGIPQEEIVKSGIGNLASRERSDKWYGIDIPEGKNSITAGTKMDRDRLNPDHGEVELHAPEFREYLAGERFPFEPGTFKLATANMVLHHIDPENLNDTLKQIHTCLADDGYFFVMEDFIGSDKEIPAARELINEIDGFFYNEKGGHQRCMGDWQRILEEAGFELVRSGEVRHWHNSGIYLKEGFLIMRKKK